MGPTTGDISIDQEGASGTMKILVTTSSFADYDAGPLDLLKEKGHDVVMNPFGRKLTKEESMELYTDNIDGVIAGTEIIDSEVLSKAVQLKVISRCGTGVDSVDVGFAKSKGIKVFNTPDAPVNSVAELTVGLVLSLLRGIPLADRKIREGVWEKNMGNLLSEKTVGIMGFGRIGKKVAVLLSGLGARVIYYDPAVDEKNADGFNKVELEVLLKAADIITLHLCYTEDNCNIFGEKELSLMKETAFLVNVSRGGIVDEEALRKILKRGKIAGAALDVFSKEPYEGPLKDMDNVILTPHIGSYAKEGRIKMELTAAENVLRGLGNNTENTGGG